MLWSAPTKSNGLLPFDGSAGVTSASVLCDTFEPVFMSFFLHPISAVATENDAMMHKDKSFVVFFIVLKFNLVALLYYVSDFRILCHIVQLKYDRTKVFQVDLHQVNVSIEIKTLILLFFFSDILFIRFILQNKTPVSLHIPSGLLGWLKPPFANEKSNFGHTAPKHETSFVYLDQNRTGC